MLEVRAIPSGLMYFRVRIWNLALESSSAGKEHGQENDVHAHTLPTYVVKSDQVDNAEFAIPRSAPQARNN